MASETSSRAAKLPKRFETWRTAIDIRDLLVVSWLEEIHRDQGEDGEESEDEGRGVGGHLVEAQVLLVHVQRERLRLAGDAPGDDCDRAVLAEGPRGRQDDAVRNAQRMAGSVTRLNVSQRDAPSVQAASS